MSVVNDVLKDLDNRRRKQRISDCISFVYEDDPVPTRINYLTVLSWAVIGVFVCLLIAIYYPNKLAPSSDGHMVPLQSDNQLIEKESVLLDEASYDRLELKLDTKDKIEGKVEVNSAPNVTQQDLGSRLIVDAENPPINLLQSGINSKANATVNNDVITDPSIEFVKHSNTRHENVLTVVNSSKQNHQVTSVKKRKNLELNLKQLLKTHPHKVWPYIQDELKQNKDSIAMLALGAQGQQRSGQHNSAIQLYQRLLDIQPSEPRWKVGLAISLDNLGKSDQALIFYQQGMYSGKLDRALQDFVSGRITQIKNRSNRER